MKNYFLFWILGVFEDTPLPYEIKNIYFCLHRENDFYYISFGGSELPLERIFNFEYYPLEAQFFNIWKFDKLFTLHSLKILLQDLEQTKKFSSVFNGTAIFFGVFGEKEIYLL